jgi:hypothetical protein
VTTILRKSSVMSFFYGIIHSSVDNKKDNRLEALVFSHLCAIVLFKIFDWLVVR